MVLTWLKVFLLLFGINFYALVASSRIAFIYQNELLISVILGYVILALCASLVIYAKNYSKPIKLKSDDSIKRTATKETLFGCLGVWVFPLILGNMLFGSSPLIADLFANETQTREYKMVSTEEFGRAIFFLKKVQVIDKYNKSAKFVITNTMLNQLNLHEGDKLVVTGRNCIAGFVIDKINGVERN